MARMQSTRDFLVDSERGAELARSLAVGARVVCDRAFTSPIGASFLAGHGFTVESVGTVNVRLRADVCGSFVWIALGDGRFYTDAWR